MKTLIKILQSKGLAIGYIVVGIALLLFTVPQIAALGRGDAEPDVLWELEPEQESPESEDEEASDADVSYISIPGFESATIDADSETVSLYLYNPEGNECYFVISIYLYEGQDGAEELIYQSKLVSPGQELYEITLERALEAGAYQAYVNYATYTMDGEYTPLNGANVPFTLTVE
ncbi:MAG: hypothetical protein LJU34_01620 [Oscillospiraceae bacterium]|nr:hypothetical protein [Oscillospiraceae bacterium]